MPKPRLEVKHQGDHHLFDLKADTSTRKVTGGGVYNFSDHSGVELQLSGGRLSGSLLHTGDTHALNLRLGRDGSLSGSYRELRREGLEIEIKAGVARLRGGRIPVDGSVEIKGAHHELDLGLDKSGNLSGMIKSHSVPGGSFQLGLSKGKLSGGFTHKGRHHRTSIEFSPKNWKGEVSVKKGQTTFALSVDGGKDLKVTSGQLKVGLKF